MIECRDCNKAFPTMPKDAVVLAQSPGHVEIVCKACQYLRRFRSASNPRKRLPKCERCRRYDATHGRRCYYCVGLCGACTSPAVAPDPYGGLDVCASHLEKFSAPRHRACGFCGSQHCDCGWNEMTDALRRNPDEERRRLERSDDPWDAYRARVDAFRRGENVGVRVGDRVRVTESTSPWMRDPTWVGIVSVAYQGGDAYVWPEGKPEPRVRTSRKYLAKGVFISGLDEIVLIEPAPPDWWERLPASFRRFKKKPAGAPRVGQAPEIMERRVRAARRRRRNPDEDVQALWREVRAGDIQQLVRIAAVHARKGQWRELWSTYEYASNVVREIGKRMDDLRAYRRGHAGSDEYVYKQVNELAAQAQPASDVAAAIFEMVARSGFQHEACPKCGARHPDYSPDLGLCHACGDNPGDGSLDRELRDLERAAALGDARAAVKLGAMRRRVAPADTSRSFRTSRLAADAVVKALGWRKTPGGFVKDAYGRPLANDAGYALRTRALPQWLVSKGVIVIKDRNGYLLGEDESGSTATIRASSDDSTPALASHRLGLEWLSTMTPPRVLPLPRPTRTASAKVVYHHVLNYLAETGNLYEVRLREVPSPSRQGGEALMLTSEGGFNRVLDNFEEPFYTEFTTLLSRMGWAWENQDGINFLLWQSQRGEAPR